MLYCRKYRITMEEQFKEQDKIIRNLIKDAGLESPSVDFKKSVMHAVYSEIPVKPYQPLISGKVWLLLGVLCFLGAILLYFYPLASEISLNSLYIIEKLNSSFSLPELHITKISGYALTFLALFLLEIPLLKKYFIRD